SAYKSYGTRIASTLNFHLPINTMNLTKQQTKKNRKVNHKKGPEQNFHKEWQRVQNLQKQLDKLKQTIIDTKEKVSAVVKNSESEKLQADGLLCERLIGFVSKKSIPDYLRVELIEWVISIIYKLETNPFVEHNNTLALKQQLEEKLRQLDLNEVEKHRKKLLKKGFSEQQIDEMESLARQADEALKARMQGKDSDIPPEIEDIFEELFGNFEETSMEDDEFGFADDADAFAYEEQYYDDIQQEEARLKQKDNELAKLLKATPINQLFRKISRAIHPDLESDEDKKRQKHEQMASLIQAREQKDIPKILNMYMQYVGELPEGLFQGNFDKLTKILKYQSEKLREEKSRIIEEDPVTNWIYNTFYDKNDQAMQRRIKVYINENKDYTRIVTKSLQTLTSIAKLRPFLEQRHCRPMEPDELY
ncbi:MAG: hypothetical protein KTR17_06250, partial [Cellvibrionaceae bacterium]|nr:hypothetical protein [Cellvibrionaceae bacterium]